MSFTPGFGINNQFTGQLQGHDRLPQTTPDIESSDWLRPYISRAYPAPYLPSLRQIQDHPQMAPIVFGAHQIVGQDKNGALVPAGLFCGTQGISKALNVTNSRIEGGTVFLTAAGAGGLKVGQYITLAGLTAAAAANGTQVVASKITGGFTVEVDAADVALGADAGTVTPAAPGQYCVFAYTAVDPKFAFNAQTGLRVASANEYVVLAAPVDGAAGDVITLPSGRTITVTSNDLAFALSCDLFPNGKVSPIGLVVRNVYQYIGTVKVGQNPDATSTATGMNYTLDPVNPAGRPVLNYMHEPMTAIQTQFVVKAPWIGATPTTLQTLASGDGVQGYIQGIGRSFTHFTGLRGNGGFNYGTPVVASSAGNGTDAGNFAPYDPTIHTPGEIIGRVIDMKNFNPVGFMNRVRMPFDRPTLGPINDPNPNSGRMGGSSTDGIPVHVNLTTDGAFWMANRQNKTLHPEYSTHVVIRVNL